MNGYDAVVVGSGPNGLAAAIELARAGRSVLVREAADEIGGGLRSGEVTLPGFVHDLCSAIHPMAAASPFFRTVPLQEHGLEWVEPPLPLAHPLDGGEAVVLRRSVEATAEELGGDAGAYARAFQPLVDAWPQLEGALLGPLVRLPRHPVPLARFGLEAIWPRDDVRPAEVPRTSPRAPSSPASRRTRSSRSTGSPRPHSVSSWDSRGTRSDGLFRAGARSRSPTPSPRTCGHWAARSSREPRSSRWRSSPARARFSATSPRVSSSAWPATGWTAATGRRSSGIATAPACSSSTGRSRARSRGRLRNAHRPEPCTSAERSTRSPPPNAAPERGETSDRPFVLLAQPTMFDPSRAPDGRHTAWGYCHVPNGSTVDMTDAIERQIERFAPGFGERVLARSAMGPADLERRNANLVGGDIAGGSNALRQLIARPALRPVPYSTPIEGVYLCSASTPPGGGVHGMCGYLAARAALRAGG